mmetsp:Transcript_43511/g.137623  ORF Transcript_43511/g.137623 Transcript_43511/m.137623 type:complete len:92 (-) Transcript_43511:55-330(-)
MPRAEASVKDPTNFLRAKETNESLGERNSFFKKRKIINTLQYNVYFCYAPCCIQSVPSSIFRSQSFGKYICLRRCHLGESYDKLSAFPAST